MASLDEYGCRIGPGEGMAARFGSVVAMVPSWQPGQRAVLEQILDVVERAGDQRAPGRALSRQLAGLLTYEDPAGVPTFAAFAQAEDGLAVFVHGDLDVAVTRSGEDELVSGRHVATWVDRIVDEPIDFVAVAAEGAGTRELDERLDLRAGIVPAGSLLLAAAPARAPSEPGPVAQPAGKVARAKTTLDGAAEDLGQVRGGLVDAEAAGAAPVSQEETSSFRTIALRGVTLDEPRAPLPIGGEPPADQPAVAPPLGLLLFDDGTTFSLDGEVVVGREPDGDPRVASGDAQPLVVTDTERSVSRLHLRIVLQGGAVELIDLRSANGTAIRRPRTRRRDSDPSRGFQDDSQPARSGKPHVHVHSSGSGAGGGVTD